MADIQTGKTQYGLIPTGKTSLAALAAFAANAPFTLTQQWYHRQEFSLDGYRFVNCHFDECRLHTSKGTFSFERCKFTSNLFIFSDEAFNSVQLFNLLGTEAWTRWPSMVPIHHEDGTFTLRIAG
jgi:hypothetical protein